MRRSTPVQRSTSVLVALIAAIALSCAVFSGTASAADRSLQQPAFVRPIIYLTSPWFPGVRFVGINYGCNPTHYYPHDARCPGRQGFHHGVDISMPVGTPIYSNVRGRVLKGGLGDAYGAKAFRIRIKNRDILLGHVSRVLVRSGQRVSPGQLIAFSGNLGAPDGAHLHFEVRRRGASFTGAVNPRRWLARTVIARVN